MNEGRKEVEVGVEKDTGSSEEGSGCLEAEDIGGGTFGWLMMSCLSVVCEQSRKWVGYKQSLAKVFIP